MAHFMMDCYVADESDDGAFRCISFFVMKAVNEAQAIEEAKSIAVWRRPASFAVRRVSWVGDKLIYKDPTEINAGRVIVF
jgi:hypothetical protein